MKLKFDGSQAYQLDAIHSIVNLFDGQPLTNSDRWYASNEIAINWNARWCI